MQKQNREFEGVLKFSRNNENSFEKTTEHEYLDVNDESENNNRSKSTNIIA